MLYRTLSVLLLSSCWGPFAATLGAGTSTSSASPPAPQQPAATVPQSQADATNPANLPFSRTRWIVMFRGRSFDLSTYRAAMRDRADVQVVSQIVGQLELAALDDQAQFADFARGFGAEVLSQWWLINGCAVHATPDIVATLRKHPRVAYVIPDRLNRAQMARKRMIPFQGEAVDEWNHNAVEAHRQGFTAVGPIRPEGAPAPSIAVLDSQLEWFDPTQSPNRSNSPIYNDASGSTRIVDSVRAANIGASTTLQAFRNNFQNSIYNSTTNFPSQHGNGITHAAAARAPQPNDPVPAPGTGQAPNASIVSIDIIEDWTQIQANFGCTVTNSARYSSTIAITDACQFLATNAALYNTLSAVCAFGGCGNPWSPEQQAMDSLVLNADIVMCVPSGNYFEDGASLLGAWPTSGETDNVNFLTGRNATAWDSMYGANSIVVGAAHHGSKIVPTWSGAGPLTPTRSSQSSSPMSAQYGSTYCAGFVPDNYFAVPNITHDFSRSYPDIVAIGAGITIQERFWNGNSVQEVQRSVDGSSVSCAQVAGAALLYRAGLDNANPQPIPSALATRAVLLAASEDVAAAQPQYPAGSPTGEDLHGAGFLRTDHALLGDADVRTGSLPTGLGQVFSFPVDADSTYGIALTWNRTVFNMAPPNVWPSTTAPQPNGLPWVNFDMQVTEPDGTQTMISSPLGNRTWEHDRITTTFAGNLQVSITRSTAGAASEPFVLTIVKIGEAAATPAIRVVPVAGGPNPCRSQVPKANGNQPTDLPANPTIAVGSSYGAWNTRVVNGQTYNNWLAPSITRAGGAQQGTSLSVPASLRGGNRMVQIGMQGSTVVTNSDFMAVDLACESDREMLLTARLVGRDSSLNPVSLNGLLHVMPNQPIARAIFGRQSTGFAGPALAPGSVWSSTFAPPTPPWWTGVDQWGQSPRSTGFLFEFEAPAGLRFLVRHGTPSGYSTTKPLPTSFAYQHYRIRVGTEVNGTVNNWATLGGGARKVVGATMWTADAQFVDPAPAFVFSDDVIAIGRPYRAEARGFEIGTPRPAAYMVGLAAAPTPLVFSGVSGGLACDCAFGLDAAAILVTVPLTTEASGSVQVPEITLPYDTNSLGFEMFHQVSVIEASQLVRSSQLIGTRIELR